MMNTIYDSIDKDDFQMRCVGRSLMEVLTETLEIKPQLHSWLPPGLTLLGGKTKSGKSTLAEQIAEEISDIGLSIRLTPFSIILEIGLSVFLHNVFAAPMSFASTKLRILIRKFSSS